MILVRSKGSGRAWRIGRSATEWVQSPSSTRSGGHTVPSAAEAGQAEDWSEQGKVKVTEP